jgi:nitrate reductase gamma subunit
VPFGIRVQPPSERALRMLLFVIFPYVSLAVFCLGHLYRYRKDPYHWNAKSSELLDKEGLRYWSALFHGGVLLVFVGHAGGLLIPQSLYDGVGIDSHKHIFISYYLGILFGGAAMVGNAGLLIRRLAVKRVRKTSSITDIVVLVLLFFVIGIGLWNVFFGHYSRFLYTVAPWIQGIVILRPDPELMAEPPITYQLHVLGAFALFALSPFTRLVHIWSAPFAYVWRRSILFRHG